MDLDPRVYFCPTYCHGNSVKSLEVCESGSRAGGLCSTFSPHPALTETIMARLVRKSSAAELRKRC